MRKIRKQLSMYVPRAAAGEIEAARQILDPVQSSLIPAHITLCREDELGDLSKIRERLGNLTFDPVTLSFGKPEVFSGHGLLLRCTEGEEELRLLREHLLDSKSIRAQAPHITLAHPRNPRSPGNSLDNASRLPEIIKITFPIIHLIEQIESEPWQVLESYKLAGRG